MALGSSWFGLLFLGSGSTFGSTSPHLPPDDSVPFSVVVLWVVNPKGIAWTHHNTSLTKRMNHPGSRVLYFRSCRRVNFRNSSGGEGPLGEQRRRSGAATMAA